VVQPSFRRQCMPAAPERDTTVSEPAARRLARGLHSGRRARCAERDRTMIGLTPGARIPEVVCSNGRRPPRRLRAVVWASVATSELGTPAAASARPHPAVLCLAAVALLVAGAACGAALRGRAAPGRAVPGPTLAPEVLAIAAEARIGGLVTLEVNGQGTIVCFSAQIDPRELPAACVDVARIAAPGGRIVSAEKQVVNGVTYFEIENDVDGRRVELLVTPDGRLVGREDEIAEGAAPARVLAAAHAVHPEGALEAVEIVEGPETLGGPEYHVKKRVGDESVRIRVTEAGAVEVLRKLKTELRLPR
jgi:hypothetical protein